MSVTHKNGGLQFLSTNKHKISINIAGQDLKSLIVILACDIKNCHILDRTSVKHLDRLISLLSSSTLTRANRKKFMTFLKNNDFVGLQPLLNLVNKDQSCSLPTKNQHQLLKKKKFYIRLAVLLRRKLKKR